jgi:uncharacterized membrane protein YidH (DUF202 family)
MRADSLSVKPEPNDRPADTTLFNEVQVILSQKRTSLSMLQTGIAVFALPLSVLSVLVATSKYYSVSDSASFLYPLLGLCLVLVSLGIFLIIHAMAQIRRHDRLLEKIRKEHSAFAEFID